ncbi:imidazoleglycerol-phosphate dehydratase HisB [Helicobacter cappadocius]|uniref:Imidazoleglycerol-phosphate dehydratase n=1 Tax=Helicobacter cappadocius TaxID=3063998 RepID=A0AA90TEY6_9HELI|nr:MULTISPECIES: imidazoleglycerol-phosphate dehydratase HisB [unclassified Helicobacter]MDO7253181.1 imidazoleglycerol-phosphate dehydratase HisB [Helicobacter sp. faydin-H75]MDP2539105.1 imidazoleglycerol-phosphate dehydratase HisB [Helicobacter sp. faydin-H76]
MKEVKRDTKETKISATLQIYGEGRGNIDTKIGFFDHMLEAFSKHSMMDLQMICEGDRHIDDHHSVEDCGIVLGGLLKEEIYPAIGIERFGNATIVMDEACVECDIDVCNRSFLVFDMSCYGDFKGKVGDFDIELVEEFFRAVCMNAGLCVHIYLKRGKNLHHIIEATFKAFALAIRRALTPNKNNQIPSTKGVL